MANGDLYLKEGGLSAAWLKDTNCSNFQLCGIPLFATSNITLPNNPAPNKPTGLSVTAGDKQVTLSWTANTEADLAGYNVYRDGVKINNSLIAKTTYNNTGLTNGTTYSYQVSAVDTAGKESEKSSSVSATPQASSSGGGGGGSGGGSGDSGGDSGGSSNQPTSPTVVAGEVVFSDVSSGAWYQSYVSVLVSKHILAGYSDGMFKPNRNVSRAEFAKMICLAQGWTLINPTNPAFTDISSSDWSYAYIETAKAHGAIGGYTDGSFKPEKNITRAEITKIIANALGLASSSSSFTDVGSHWARDSIGACAKTGIVGGYLDNTFKPDNTATRAEAAKMIYGMIKL